MFFYSWIDRSIRLSCMYLLSFLPRALIVSSFHHREELKRYITQSLIPNVFNKERTRIDAFSFAGPDLFASNLIIPGFRPIYNLSQTPRNGNRTALIESIQSDSRRPAVQCGTETQRAINKANAQLDRQARPGLPTRRFVIMFTNG